jgi:hypothetical protein
VTRLRNKDGDLFTREHLRWIDAQPDLSSLSIEGFTLAGAHLGEVLARVATAGCRHLHLWDAGLGPYGAERIAGSPALRALETLDLHNNQVADDGAIALAASPHLAGLRTLVLSGNELRDVGALALARSPHLGALTTLALSENKIGEAARQALHDRFGDAALPGLDHQHRWEDTGPRPYLQDDHRSTRVQWSSTWSPDAPFQAEVGSQVWVLVRTVAGLTLYVDGEPAGDAEPWPTAWKRPGAVTLRVELVAWAKMIIGA